MLLLSQLNTNYLLITHVSPRRPPSGNRVINENLSRYSPQCDPVSERTLTAGVPADLRHRGAM
jgi:hypothetical protein